MGTQNGRRYSEVVVSSGLTIQAALAIRGFAIHGFAIHDFDYSH